MLYPRSMPTTIIASFNETSRPRTAAGDISPMYAGACRCGGRFGGGGGCSTLVLGGGRGDGGESQALLGGEKKQTLGETAFISWSRLARD